jgi:hypothetical protein
LPCCRSKTPRAASLHTATAKPVGRTFVGGRRVHGRLQRQQLLSANDVAVQLLQLHQHLQPLHALRRQALQNAAARRRLLLRRRAARCLRCCVRLHGVHRRRCCYNGAAEQVPAGRQSACMHACMHVCKQARAGRAMPPRRQHHFTRGVHNNASPGGLTSCVRAGRWLPAAGKGWRWQQQGAAAMGTQVPARHHTTAAAAPPRQRCTHAGAWCVQARHAAGNW